MSMIWKYALTPIDEQRIELPSSAESIVHVGRDPGGNPCIWVLITDPEAEKKEFRFKVVGTGHPFDSAVWCYRGSWVQDGTFVFHLLVPMEGRL